MQESSVFSFINKVLSNVPQQWLDLTTHRLDIYNEDKAKAEFIDGFKQLFQNGNSSQEALQQLPTAYDYIRLGHPLTCVLEWLLAKSYDVQSEQVIAFGSETMAIMAVLRKNSLDDVRTRLVFENEIPDFFDVATIKKVYEYDFEIVDSSTASETLDTFEGKTIFVTTRPLLDKIELQSAEFIIHLCGVYGSVITVRDKDLQGYISAIQHVRRRETVAMTPRDTHEVLKSLVSDLNLNTKRSPSRAKSNVRQFIQEISGLQTTSFLGTSGLSVQYAIMMGLVDHAKEVYPNKKIKFIVPTNCYGGTNDQARRVAESIERVEIVDLEVDGDNDMVSGLKIILEDLAKKDAVPYIIAEIPTNPRVEVPELEELKQVLSKERYDKNGNTAVAPVFILDQTFCPNLQFMKEGEVLSQVRGITYASGSKFPSGGRCTAGYCYTNDGAKDLEQKIEKHLELCDNEATALQYKILSEQLPSMNQRIAAAYANTREFVDFIAETLPEAKMNFVSNDLAERGFTASVFSLDLPTKGATVEEREKFKRAQNLRLIHMMIDQIPEESKFCVSYGQLKGCYWTVPATSTQGTTKEKDKDYIVRASLSPDLDLEKHKEVFKKFVDTYGDVKLQVC